MSHTERLRGLDRTRAACHYLVTTPHKVVDSMPCPPPDEHQPPPPRRSPNRGIVAGSLILSPVGLGAGIGYGLGALVGATALLVILGVFAGFAAGIALVIKRFGDL